MTDLLVNATTGEIVADCTPEEARVLTEQMRSTAEALWMIAAQVQDRRAWAALGYESFAAYMKAEFNYSRSHAYRLLDQARVIEAIRGAIGQSPNGDSFTVDETTARDLKPHLSDVVKKLEEATRDTEPELKAEAAKAAIEILREEIVAEREEAKAEKEDLPPKPAITKPDLGDGVSHPARYSKELYPLFVDLLGTLFAGAPASILDPFAGTGGIHRLKEHGYRTVGIELEKEWADLHPDTVCGSALDLPFGDETFDAIVTSPTYGNRLADSHNASDPELRRSYTHDLGRGLSVDNSGAMQWGQKYRDFHEEAWTEALRVLTTDGVFLLNIKDHIRAGARQHVSGWHVTTLCRMGLTLLEHHDVATGNLRQGANASLRFNEQVYVFVKDAK
jgi:SAM-dependent methyltransferase